MAVNAFGVTAATLHDVHFGHVSDFSADSVPTDTTVTVLISAKAAVVNARLLQEGIDPAGITDTASPAYLTLADIVRMEAAIAVMQRMTSQNPELLKVWQSELKRFYDDLDSLGYAALGISAPSTTTEGYDGPHSHIDGNGLETEDAADISPVTHKLRAGDML